MVFSVFIIQFWMFYNGLLSSWYTWSALNLNVVRDISHFWKFMYHILKSMSSCRLTENHLLGTENIMKHCRKHIQNIEIKPRNSTGSSTHTGRNSLNVWLLTCASCQPTVPYSISLYFSYPVYKVRIQKPSL